MRVLRVMGHALGDMLVCLGIFWSRKHRRIFRAGFTCWSCCLITKLRRAR